MFDNRIHCDTIVICSFKKVKSMVKKKMGKK